MKKMNEIINKLLDQIKSHKKVSIGVGVILILIIGVIFLSIHNRGNIFIFSEGDAEKFKREYENLNDKYTSDDKLYPEVSISSTNPIKYSNFAEVLDIIDNDGDAVIYLGYSKCLYCRSAVQVLLDTASKIDIETIYYIDIEKKSENYEDFAKILEKIQLETDLLVQDSTICSPLVLFITDGEIISYNKGTLFSQTDPYTELDTSQIEGLSEIYKYGFTDVVNSINIKKNTTSTS